MTALFGSDQIDPEARLTLPVESISALCGAPRQARRARPVPAGQETLLDDDMQLDLFTQPDSGRLF